ncbi:MAG TPA: LPS export ABC transporter periplasmic protein LptC [Steroidobacteraceae bacterium]
MILRIFAGLIVAAIIVGSIWLGGQQREAAPTTTIQSPSGDLGYSALNAVLTETGPDGLPLYTLHADTIRQHPGDGVAFEHVNMSFRDQSGQIWTARAQHGELGQDTTRVELSGDVHVDGLLPGSPQNADFATQKLSIDTEADVVSTAEPVTVNWGGRQLNSTGLVASLKERRVLLESQVHGTFLPNLK